MKASPLDAQVSAVGFCRVLSVLQNKIKNSDGQDN